MRVRQRLITLVSLAVINGLALIIAAIEFHSAFAILAIVVPAVFGAMTLAIRCPRCGHPVMKRNRRVAGERWSYWGGFTIPRNCPRCGLSFVDDNPESGERVTPV